MSSFVFKSKANIFDNVLRNHFLLLLLSSTSSNSNWIWSLNNARKLKTPSVESVSSLFLSKYSSSSFDISSNINALSVEKPALICENPKRFCDVSIGFSTEIIYTLFSQMLDVIFLTYFLKGVFYLKMVCFLSEIDVSFVKCWKKIFKVRKMAFFKIFWLKWNLLDICFAGRCLLEHVSVICSFCFLFWAENHAKFAFWCFTSSPGDSPESRRIEKTY